MNRRDALKLLAAAPLMPEVLGGVEAAFRVSCRGPVTIDYGPIPSDFKRIWVVNMETGTVKETLILRRGQRYILDDNGIRPI